MAVDKNSESPSRETSASDSVENGQGVSVAEVEKLKEEVEKWKKDYLYLRAEFDNYRKHVIKERADLQKYAAEGFLREFLEIMDDFDRALQSPPTGDNYVVFAEGVNMIAKKIRQLLQKQGVSMEECLHQPFDPAKHEAVGSETSVEVKPGYITRVIKAPYRYHDKLLRHGQVLVAVEPASSGPGSQG